MTKYTSAPGDGLETLRSDDDPATKVWGPKWRTPTSKEFDELLDKLSLFRSVCPRSVQII